MGNESEQNSHHAGPIIAYIEMSSSSGSESGRSKALAQPCSASLRANRLVTPENVWIDETLVVFSGPIFSTLEPPLYSLMDDACLFLCWDVSTDGAEGRFVARLFVRTPHFYQVRNC